MVKLLLFLVGGCLVALVGLAVTLIAVIGSNPWLAAGVGGIQVQDNRPKAVAMGTPASQWPLIVRSARESSCGVSAEDLAAIAKVESDFGRNLLNPRSGAFGYGQFDAATWAAHGQGDPNDPADALPAMARTLCARGYGTTRTRALNSYGGCVTPLCLGQSDYATLIDRSAASLLRPATGVIELAQQWLGVRYAFGGCDRHGIDCSCLVMLVYRAIGISLPRTADQQFRATARVSRDELAPGDLVFFANTYMSGISHVGIFIGGGQMINAPSEGSSVSVMSVFDGYWGAHYAGGGRVA